MEEQGPDPGPRPGPDIVSTSTGPTFPLGENGVLKPEWLDLIGQFPDWFVLGSDEIIKPSNDRPSAGSIVSTVSLLDQLPDSLRDRMGYGNALFLKGLSRD